MEKLKQLVWRWLGGEMRAQLHAAQVLEVYVREQFSPALDEMRGRIDDLETAYPNYKKAKEQADADKAKEVVPGFVPFSQRKRRFEAAHRKPPQSK